MHSVGAQSTFGKPKHFCRNVYKITNCPNFAWYLPEKLGITQLTKCPEFYMVIDRKFVLPFFGRGAQALPAYPPPFPTPVMRCKRTHAVLTGCEKNVLSSQETGMRGSDIGSLQLVIRSLNKQPHKHAVKWLIKIALALDVMTNISYKHIILSKKSEDYIYVELFIIRVKLAIYYFLHFNTVRQVAARLRAKSAIYDCFVANLLLNVSAKGMTKLIHCILLQLQKHGDLLFNHPPCI